jgi:hypothetical protein
MADFMKWYHSAIDGSLYAWFHLPTKSGKKPWKLIMIRADRSWHPSAYPEIHSTNKLSYTEVKPSQKNLRALFQIVLDQDIREWFK